MTRDDPKIIVSPLSTRFTRDGITVSVEIYRIEGTGPWTLELVDGEGSSTIWEEPFPTDQAALEEFHREVEKYGLGKVLEGDDEDTATIH